MKHFGEGGGRADVIYIHDYITRGNKSEKPAILNKAYVKVIVAILCKCGRPTVDLSGWEDIDHSYKWRIHPTEHVQSNYYTIRNLTENEARKRGTIVNWLR